MIMTKGARPCQAGSSLRPSSATGARRRGMTIFSVRGSLRMSRTSAGGVWAPRVPARTERMARQPRGRTRGSRGNISGRITSKRRKINRWIFVSAGRGQIYTLHPFGVKCRFDPVFRSVIRSGGKLFQGCQIIAGPDDDGREDEDEDAGDDQPARRPARGLPLVEIDPPQAAEGDDEGHVDGPAREVILAHLGRAHAV